MCVSRWDLGIEVRDEIYRVAQNCNGSHSCAESFLAYEQSLKDKLVYGQSEEIGGQGLGI